VSDRALAVIEVRCQLLDEGQVDLARVLLR
jgi:hypothetical protein